MLFNFLDRLAIYLESPPSTYVLALEDYKNYLVSHDAAGGKPPTRVDIDFRGMVPDRVKGCIYDRRGKALWVDFETVFAGGAIHVENGFSRFRFREIFKNILLLGLLKNSIIPVHASSAELNGKVILLAARPNSGKTRVLLNMIRNGAVYIGDEWSLLTGGMVGPLDLPFVMMDYDIAEFPDVAGVNSVEKVVFRLGSLIRNPFVRSILSRTGILPRYRKYAASDMFSRVSGGGRIDRIYFLEREAEGGVARETLPKEKFISDAWEVLARENEYLLNHYDRFKKATGRKNAFLEGLEEAYKNGLGEAISGTLLFALHLPRRFSGISLEDIL
jgi:hypothetical protein